MTFHLIFFFKKKYVKIPASTFMLMQLLFSYIEKLYHMQILGYKVLKPPINGSKFCFAFLIISSLDVGQQT